MGVLHYFGLTGPPHEPPEQPRLSGPDFWQLVLALVLGNLIAAAIATAIAVVAFDLAL